MEKSSSVSSQSCNWKPGVFLLIFMFKLIQTIILCLSAAFGLLGIIIYAADMGPGLDLSWSFALTIVGSLGCGAAGGLLVPALSQTAA